MVQLLILADDFTGALDTGVQLAVGGAKTKVITLSEGLPALRDPDFDVLCIDTETRHLAPAQAHEVIRSITAQAKDEGIPYLYKKTDSALRGNLGAELSAALTASGQETLPFVPAFPQLGRCTVDGVHYIEGVPVAESVFGKEPFNPVVHSNVADLLHEQCATPVYFAAPAEAPQQPGICVYNAQSEADLAAIAQTLAGAGKTAVLAGCAGFGAFLPDLLGLPKDNKPEVPKLDERLLVICGSINPITVEQMDRAEAAGFVRCRLSPQQKLDPDYWQRGHGAALISQLQRTLAASPQMIIDSNDTDGNRMTTVYASVHGLDTETVRARISHTLGQILGALFGSAALGTLLVTGGDTLMECMNTMGVHEMEPLCELVPGVVLSRFSYHGVTRCVITKSGGFGEPDLLTDLVEKIKG